MISWIIMLESRSIFCAMIWSSLAPSACWALDWYVLSSSAMVMACPFTSAATSAGGECLQEARYSAAAPAARTTRRRFIGVSLYCSPEGGCRDRPDCPKARFLRRVRGALWARGCPGVSVPGTCRLFGLGVVIGVLAIEFGSACAVGHNAEDVVLAERLHGAGHVIERGGTDFDHQDGAIGHGGEQVGIGREQQRRRIEDSPVEAAGEFLEEQLGLSHVEQFERV